MYNFNLLKVLMIATALVIVSAFAIASHAGEPATAQKSLPDDATYIESETAPWLQYLWTDLRGIGERLFATLPEPANYVERLTLPEPTNYVERLPYADPVIEYEDEVVYEPEDQLDRTM